MRSVKLQEGDLRPVGEVDRKAEWGSWHRELSNGRECPVARGVRARAGKKLPVTWGLASVTLIASDLGAVLVAPHGSRVPLSCIEPLPNSKGSMTFSVQDRSGSSSKTCLTFFPTSTLFLSPDPWGGARGVCATEIDTPVTGSLWCPDYFRSLWCLTWEIKRLSFCLCRDLSI